ncbi:hypothetical protein PR202_ga20648 [Eleusine coracana subsp. coracana]|uniref:Uncharacterized protein n=1 Tax=Eleusine coracana subsp. coracana TaxID=191504 RepID=A0AAV5CYU0_ELECO|nr:hypothetical protein QOZ80_4AG0321780 [Eleusine coracana subsp. coracana]GJN03228.1 hypothetical protein PR202_ga20648 [Eleusine coracana subsp. coracana]
MAMTTVKLALMLVVLVQIVTVLAAAARPLEGNAGSRGGGWLESGIGMVTQMVGSVKPRANPRTHCC